MATGKVTIDGRTIELQIPDRTLTIFDASGKILATEPGKNKALRYSVRGAADQRQLDALCAQHPTAVRGTINTSEFIIKNGKSAFILPGA